mgnify:CR=1 FL=1
MRRREFLRAAAGTAGLAGLTASALPTAGHGRDRPRSSGSDRSTSDGSTASDAAATDRADFGPMGRVAVTNDSGSYQATDAATTPDGRYAFVSKLDGFHTVDLADPGDPEIVATREATLGSDGEVLGQLKDLKHDRERVLVVSDDYGGGPNGLAVFDVSDPTDPVQTRSFETGYPVHNADLYRDHAYLTTGPALEIVDVAADQPSLVAAWSVTDYDDTYQSVQRSLRNLHDIRVERDRAYLAYWDAGAWILDVSDPTTPTHLGHAADYTAEELAGLEPEEVGEHFYEPPGNAHYAQPSDDGTLLAVGAESWNVEGPSIEGDEPASEDTGGPGGIALYDITDPANPRELAAIDPPLPPEGETAKRSGGYYTTAHNFDIVGDVLYSSWYRAGVKVHDISDPANPVELAHWADGAETSFWTARCAVPGEYFVGVSHGNFDDQSRPGGLYVFPDPAEATATITPNVTPTPTATPTAAGPSAETPTEPATDGPTDGGTDSGNGGAGGDPSASPTGTPQTDGDTATAPATPDPTTTGGAGPGLGVLGALAGLGAGAWRLGRRSGDDGPDR